MPKPVHECIGKLMTEEKPEGQAWAICNTEFADNKMFTDSLTFDPKSKTAISVRDGVQEYLGVEIGYEPADKVFRIYRSPATIANCVNMLDNLPITTMHVSLESPATDVCGSINSSVLIDHFDENTDSTIAVKNQVSADPALIATIESGKKELSLGYKGKLIPHGKYDLEQVNLIPHHLAVVDRGRCGDVCTFIDTHLKGDTMKIHQAFLDADGNPSLEEIVEIAMGLPEAIKKLDADTLSKVMPTLQEIVAMAKTAETPEDERAEQGLEQTDEVAETTDEPVEDEDETVPMADTAVFQDAVTKAVSSALARHTAVIEKAQGFVDSTYTFAGKKTCQIMRDALAVEHGNQQFSDAELPVAFKLLKKAQSDLSNFGDEQHNKFKQLANKEL